MQGHDVVEQFSQQAEQSVIGALLIDNDAIDRMGDLRAEHFYLGDHRIMFAEIVSQISVGKQCDVISLFDAIEGKVDDCLEYSDSLVRNTPSSANIGRYAGIVKDKAIKRGLAVLGSETIEIANSIEDSAVLVDRVSSKLGKLAEARIKQEPVKATEEMGVYIDELEARRTGQGSKATPTGFADLDKRLSGGIRAGELIVVAGRPKMGKTAFALSIARNISFDYSVLVLSMEMPKQQLHDRNVSALGHIDLAHLLQPTEMTDIEWDGLTVALKKLDVMNLYQDDQGGLRLLDVRMKAKQVKRKAGLDVLIIDYLQLMEGDGDNRNAQIEQITRGLKALAKELGIAIILLSQLNRKLEERPNKRPQPCDLRDSGSIEQDADAVIMLYRDEVYNPDSTEKGICEVNVALCRQGAPGCVGMAYIGNQTRFENLAHWSPKPAQDNLSKRRSAAHL